MFFFLYLRFGQNDIILRFGQNEMFDAGVRVSHTTAGSKNYLQDRWPFQPFLCTFPSRDIFICHLCRCRLLKRNAMS